MMLFEFRKVLRVSWLRVGSVMWVRYSGVAMRSSLITSEAEGRASFR